MRGRTSTIVTFAPKRAYIEANSTPTAPEPMTTSDFGTSASSSIEVEDRIVLSSISMPGQRPRRRARGDDDVLRAINASPRRRRRPRETRPGPGEPAEAGGDVDPVLLHQVGDAVGRLADDLLLVLHRRRHVEPDLARRDADLGAVPRLLEQVGRVEQGLGRDAAPERADAAQPRLLLDDQDRQAELRRPDRGDVAARARADDDEVVGFDRAHGSSLREAAIAYQRVASGDPSTNARVMRRARRSLGLVASLAAFSLALRRREGAGAGRGSRSASSAR